MQIRSFVVPRTDDRGWAAARWKVGCHNLLGVVHIKSIVWIHWFSLVPRKVRYDMNARMKHSWHVLAGEAIEQLSFSHRTGAQIFSIHILPASDQSRGSMGSSEGKGNMTDDR